MYNSSIITRKADGSFLSVCVAEVVDGKIIRSNGLQTYDGTAGTPAYEERFKARFAGFGEGLTFQIVAGTEAYKAMFDGGVEAVERLAA